MSARKGLKGMAEYRTLLIDGSIQTVEVRDGSFVTASGKELRAEDQAHLPPVTPQTIICVHLNYRSRLDELRRTQPPAPTYFAKAVSSLNSHKGAIIRPPNCRYLNYEGEIALIVGRTCRNVSQSEAAEYVLGYSIGNDLGLHDFRDTDDNSMLRVKGSDTLGPIGPGLVTEWDFRNKRLITRVDGQIVQDSNTEDMLWDPHYLLADISRTITLKRGDVILTGTPANSRPVEPGSTISVEVEGLGRLENKVVSGDLPVPDSYGARPSDSDSVRRIALGSDFFSKEGHT